MFRVSFVAAMCYTLLQKRRRMFPDMEKPRPTFQEARPEKQNPTLGSDMDPGLRFATPMLTQRQEPFRTRKAVFKLSIGGRETIRHYFIVRGGSQLDVVL